MEKVNFLLLWQIFLLFLSFSAGTTVAEGTLCNVCECEESEVHCTALRDADLLRSYSEGPVSLLTITYSSLNELREEDLVNFFEVTELRIQYCDLGVNGKVFLQLSNLLILVLSDNHIEQLEDDTFAGLSKLIELDLSGNRLEALTGTAFKDAEMLDSLVLSGNQLHTLDMSSGLEMLSHLDLSNNNIENLERNFLHGLWTLHHLDLSNNNIKNLKENILYWVEALTSLNLSGNRISDVDEFSFKNVESLEILDLSGNLLENLADTTFVDLSELKFLDLSRNRLRTVSGTLLEPLESLEELRLDGNELRTIDSDLARQLARPTLKTSLRDNPFNCTCGSLGEAYEIFDNPSSVYVFCDGDENIPWSDAIPLICSNTVAHVIHKDIEYDLMVDIIGFLSFPSLDWIKPDSKDSENDDQGLKNSGENLNMAAGTESENSKGDRDSVATSANGDQYGDSNSSEDGVDQTDENDEEVIIKTHGSSHNTYSIVLGVCLAVFASTVVAVLVLYLYRRHRNKVISDDSGLLLDEDFN